MIFHLKRLGKYHNLVKVEFPLTAPTRQQRNAHLFPFTTGQVVHNTFGQTTVDI
jgi:hypothetical protein